jgi:type II secretory pathway pseudopilin PulG
MAILVAIIAPNLTKYLGKSKKNTDKKNADEIASQVQTAISDYESQEGVAGINKDFTIEWDSSGLKALTEGTDKGTDTDGQTLEQILKANITSSTKSKEVKDKYAVVEVTYDKDSGRYKIVATIGNASSEK